MRQDFPQTCLVGCGAKEGPEMTLSHSMLAIEISSPGGPEVLQPTSVPVPVPKHGQIIIRVA